MMKRNNRKHLIVLLLATVAFLVISAVSVSAVSVNTATGLVNSSDGAIIRAKASTSAKKIVVANNDAKLTIHKSVFISKTSTSKSKIWYQVTYKAKKGYIRADLVDNIKYTPVKGKLTKTVNYRVGPATEQSIKGKFTKGTTVSVVLKSNLKGSSTVWYKVKKGSKYYYVKSKYFTLVEQAPSFIISASTTYPSIVGQGSSFSLQGIVSCSKTMEKCVFGIMNTSEKWVTSASAVTNSKSFDIGSVDNSIKFGTLAAGTYYYRGYAYVSGKKYNVINKKFTVKKMNGAEKLTKTAIALAWPLGTDESKYLYGSGGAPTEAYKNALDACYPGHGSGQASSGASCDMFVATVCSYSGYDKNVPKSVSSQWTYFANSNKWNAVDYSYSTSQLKSGDIVIYKKTNGNWHVCMYVTISGKGYIAEASYTNKKYAFIQTSLTKITKSSDKTQLKVYRAAS